MKNAPLGQRIKALRGTEARPAFARRFDVSVDTIVRYENGQTFPGTDFIQKMCNYYNVSADWLIFGGEGCPAPLKKEWQAAPLTQKESPKNYNYHKIDDKWTLDLAPVDFKALWDQYWNEKEVRRGWLQVEVTKRFPEFLEWLEQRPSPFSATQITSLNKNGPAPRHNPADQLEDN